MIKLSQSFVGQPELDLVSKVIEGAYLGMGSFTREFEENLSEFLSNIAVTSSSGTAAIQLALQACNVGPSDFVLVPALTYVATFQAITAVGAQPIFCDVDSFSLALDIKSIPDELATKAKALIIVHYAGYALCLEPYLEFCHLHGLTLIEDAAHAYGSVYSGSDGQLVGSHKESVCCFSFDGIKNITCGEGGCVSTADNVIAERIRDARLLGVIKDSDRRYNAERSWAFDVDSQGWRYHMPNLHAAIGLAQYRRQDTIFSIRKDLGVRYLELLEPHSNICTPFYDRNKLECSVPHIFPIILSDNLDREELRERMATRGIEVGIHYLPGHNLTFFKENLRTDLNITEKYCSRLLSIPIHPNLKDEDVCAVVDALIDEAR